MTDAQLALSVNLPTVYSTFSRTMTGRMASSLYAQMQMDAAMRTSAASVYAYVQTAVKLGKDDAWRQAVKREIAAKKETVYERAQAVDQFLP